jgi:acyl carrier protein
MNTPLAPNQIRKTVLQLLGEIAPEADLTALTPGVSFRDQLDIDSMDFLNFVIMIHKTFGVEIPEADYPKYGTLNGCVDQLLDKRVT